MSENFDDELKDIDHSQLRKHNRYNIATACRIFNIETNAQTDTFLTTISVGGVSFVYPEIIAKGSILRIEFDMPNGSKVNRFIEIKRFDVEVKTFPSALGQPCVGFEHGSKFIIIQKAKAEENEISQAKAPLAKEEIFKNCFYHIEYYRANSSVLRHGYINRMGDKHIFFHTLAEPQLGEKILANIAINDEDYKVEKKMKIEIIEVIKESKLYLSKGVILN
jgi:hypothetical protein